MNSAFFAGRDFNEDACEGIGSTKYDAARDATIVKGICPPCLQQPGWDGLANNTLLQVDAANVLVHPCTLGP